MENVKIPLYFVITLFFLSCKPTQDISDHNLLEYRQEHRTGLVQGERAPLEQEDLKHVKYFDYNNFYRMKASYTEIKKGEVFDMATYSGMTKKYKTVGKLTFTLHEKPYQLFLYQNVKYANHPEYGKYYFLPFKDLSNGIETYGGGRYLDIPKKELKKEYVLDFNKAYNPWCAYSDGYNCPVPPIENHLQLIIRAGEKNYDGEMN